MTVHITPTDLKLLDTEPRVQDLHLAEALEFAQPYDIRKLIKRNDGELTKYGEVFATVAKTLPNGGRPTEEYWLNEPQCVLVCMFSRTDKAADVRKEIIDVFLAWRRGRLPDGAPAPGGAAFDFPAGAEGLAGYRMKLDTIKEARLLHGPVAARRMWTMLGLPPVPGFEPARDSDAWACLRHLLDYVWNYDAGGAPARTLGEWIEIAIDRGEDLAAQIKKDGICIVDDDARPGFILANRHPTIDNIFRATKWKGRHPYVLRRLPGVAAGKRFNCGMVQSRGTFIPAELIGESEPAALGTNVVPLRND